MYTLSPPFPPSLFLSLPPVVSLQPYCDQIDQVKSSVSALEQMAYRLDAYYKVQRNGKTIVLCTVILQSDVCVCVCVCSLILKWNLHAV